MPYPYDRPVVKKHIETYLLELRAIRLVDLILSKRFYEHEIKKSDYEIKLWQLQQHVKETYWTEGRQTNVFDDVVALADQRYIKENPEPIDPHKCEHKHTEIRKQMFADSTIHCRKQCLNCGKKVSDAKKPKFTDNIPWFDQELYLRWYEWNQGRHNVKEEALNRRSNIPRFDYLKFRQEYEQMHPAPFNPSECLHPSSTLKRRVLRNGHISYVEQCDTCGRQTGDPKPHHLVYNSDSLLSFDEDKLDHLFEIESQWSKPYVEARKAAEEEHRNKIKEGFLNGKYYTKSNSAYENYYDSDQWSTVRMAIFERDSRECQSCGKPAEQVHHILYDRLGSERSFDLISLCRSCHSLVHIFQNSWLNIFLTPTEIRNLHSRLDIDPIKRYLLDPVDITGVLNHLDLTINDIRYPIKGEWEGLLDQFYWEFSFFWDS